MGINTYNVVVPSRRSYNVIIGDGVTFGPSLPQALVSLSYTNNNQTIASADDFLTATPILNPTNADGVFEVILGSVPSFLSFDTNTGIVSQIAGVSAALGSYNFVIGFFAIGAFSGFEAIEFNVTVSVSLAYSFSADTTNIETGSSDLNSLRIPIVKVTGSPVIDWGDGTLQTITTAGTYEHVYQLAGVKSVSIEGLVSVQYNNEATNDKLKLVDVTNVSGLEISTTGSFYGCTNINWTATNAPTISTTSLLQTFRESSMSGDISAWNVSNVTNMSALFMQNPTFNRNLSSWDVSNCTNFASMFRDASSFNGGSASGVSNTGIFNLDLSGKAQVSIFSMFQNATSFNCDIRGWNMNALSYNSNGFNNIFSGATSFAQDLSNWVVSAVSRFINAFNNNTLLNTNFSNWDMSLGLSAQSMFRLSSFNENIGSWDLSSMTDLVSIFDDTSLSNANYNLTLKGWMDAVIAGDWTPQNNVVVGANNNIASGDGLTARSYFITNYSWVFVDATP